MPLGGDYPMTSRTQQTSGQQSERPLWMAPALQEKFDVLALVGSSLLFGLLMQSTLDCWP